MPEPLELTILMPCLNEAETLEICMTKARRWMEEAGVHGEILIADNGSTDGSIQLAEKNGARLTRTEIKGYGSTLLTGIHAAQGKYIIMGDADDSYDFSRLTPFLEKLRAGYQLVMGNRFRGGIAPGAMPPLHRYLGNPILTAIGRLFFVSEIKDFHCGMRGFDRAAILSLNLRTAGMEFATEMVVKATLNQLKVIEVPTTLSPDGRGRPPHLRSWRDGWRCLRFLLMYSPRWLFFMPGLFCIVLGLVLGALVLPGPLTIRGIHFDIHSLLFASALIIIGHQAIIFALFTKKFAIEERLLPHDPFFQKMSKHLTLETGLLLGLALFCTGLFFSCLATFQWARQSFGQLDPTVVMRHLIPSVTAMITGVQTIFSSFFLSILGLRRH